MVFGYPGRTQEYLTAVEMDQLVNVENARRVEIRDVLLSIMDAEMRADAEVQLKYASKYARIANGWKKWIGQIEGVAFTKGVDRKRKLEAEFTARIAADANLWDKYGSLLNDIAVVSTQMSEGTYKRNEFIETVYYGMEWFNLANRLGRMEGEAMNAAIVSFDKDFSYEVSAKTTAAMLELATRELPEISELTGDAALFNTTIHNELKTLTAAAQRGDIFELDSLAPKMAAFTSGAFGIYRANSPSAELASKASELKSTYMKALIEVFPERNFYPNANSTLRVTYGKLEGVSPRDAVSYGTTTYLDGAMAKYKPGDYEFDMPSKLIELYDNKDYGDYAENGKLPVCNIASNHTTGGNSGSPVLNARGELIGLNFDRIWEGTMSDVNFDANICRNIMVDSRYVLFIIDKFAGQRWLIDEMELIK